MKYEDFDNLRTSDIPRNMIIAALKNEALTVSEIAAKLKINHWAVKFQLQRIAKSGMLERLKLPRDGNRGRKADLYGLVKRYRENGRKN